MTKRDDTNSIQKSTIAFGEYTNVNHAKDIVALLILQAGGRITARDSAGKLSTSLVSRAGETQQPSESALRFYTEFANPVKTYYSWNRAIKESRQVFATGDLALYIGLASEEPLIRRINPNLNFTVASVPQIRGGNRALDVGYVYAFAVPKAGGNQQSALTVAYLLASQKPSQLLSQALGIPSARRDILSTMVTCFACSKPGSSCSASQKAECSQVLQSLGLSGTDDLFNKMAIMARAWTDPDPEKTDVIFRDMIEGITSGSARLSEAIQRADQAMTLLMSI